MNAITYSSFSSDETSTLCLVSNEYTPIMITQKNGKAAKVGQ